MQALDETVGLVSSDLRGAMHDLLKLQEQLVRMASRSSMELESSRELLKYICGERIVPPAGRNPPRRRAFPYRKVLVHGDGPRPAEMVLDGSPVSRVYGYCQVEQ